MYLCEGGTISTSTPAPVSSHKTLLSSSPSENVPLPLQEIQIQLILAGGIGISIIQRNPPLELVYAKLSGLLFEYQSNPHHRNVDCSIRDIQVILLG